VYPGFGADPAIAAYSRRSLLARRRFCQTPPRAAGRAAGGRQRAQEAPAVVVRQDVEQVAIRGYRFQGFRGGTEPVNKGTGGVIVVGDILTSVARLRAPRYGEASPRRRAFPLRHRPPRRT
jgi:hypothetical protein